jgi:hypothetical protein
MLNSLKSCEIYSVFVGCSVRFKMDAWSIPGRKRACSQCTSWSAKGVCTMFPSWRYRSQTAVFSLLLPEMVSHWNPILPTMAMNQGLKLCWNYKWHHPTFIFPSSPKPAGSCCPAPSGPGFASLRNGVWAFARPPSRHLPRGICHMICQVPYSSMVAQAFLDVHWSL